MPRQRWRDGAQLQMNCRLPGTAWPSSLLLCAYACLQTAKPTLTAVPVTYFTSSLKTEARTRVAPAAGQSSCHLVFERYKRLPWSGALQLGLLDRCTP